MSDLPYIVTGPGTGEFVTEAEQIEFRERVSKMLYTHWDQLSTEAPTTVATLALLMGYSAPRLIALLEEAAKEKMGVLSEAKDTFTFIDAFKLQQHYALKKAAQDRRRERIINSFIILLVLALLGTGFYFLREWWIVDSVQDEQQEKDRKLELKAKCDELQQEYKKAETPLLQQTLLEALRRSCRD